MLERARRLERIGKGRTQAELIGDVDLYEATLRNIEILGEAAKNVPQETRDLAPKIPWRTISRTRDILAHVYFGIDDAIIWQIVTVNAPAIIEPLEKLLKNFSGGKET